MIRGGGHSEEVVIREGGDMMIRGGGMDTVRRW